jgi:hypothetical protein
MISDMGLRHKKKGKSRRGTLVAGGALGAPRAHERNPQIPENQEEKEKK